MATQHGTYPIHCIPKRQNRRQREKNSDREGERERLGLKQGVREGKVERNRVEFEVYSIQARRRKGREIAQCTGWKEE